VDISHELTERDVHGPISGTSSAFVGRVEENSEDTGLVESVPRPIHEMKPSRRKLRKTPFLFLQCVPFNYFLFHYVDIHRFICNS